MPRGALLGEPIALGAPPYERRPRDHCFVLARDPDTGDAVAQVMQWGLPVGDTQRRRLHVRVDQLAGRRLGRMLRCIVPVSGYIQPGFRRTRIAVTLACPMSIAIAAVWKKQVGGSSFAIVTTDSAEELAPMLACMPVLLPPATWPGWMADTILTPADLDRVGRPAPSAWLRARMLKGARPSSPSLSVAQQVADWAPGTSLAGRPTRKARPGASLEADHAVG